MTLSQSKKKVLESKARRLAKLSVKLDERELKMSLRILNQQMRLAGCPFRARLSYLNTLEKRIKAEGSPFLSDCRSFTNYGAKLLGGDISPYGKVGFKLAKGQTYPRLFSWFWSVLVRFSEADSVSLSDSHKIKLILTILNFSKMLRFASKRHIERSLMEFEQRISRNATIRDPGAKPTGYYATTSTFKETFGHGFKKSARLPEYFDPGSLSLKPSALKPWDKKDCYPRLPKFFRILVGDQVTMGLGNTGISPDRWFYEGPYGSVTLIVESAGKLRIICPYNSPFIHSTSLYARARYYLRQMVQDCSEDQTKGHRYARALSTKGKKTVCADLSNMTDDLTQSSILFGLAQLRISKLRYYFFNLQVDTPLGNVVTPRVLLMGLRGCFELGSILHHHLVRNLVTSDYRICGDDLIYPGELDLYKDAIPLLGPGLNRSKTIVSSTVTTFCGKYYFKGQDVSPVTVPVKTFTNGKNTERFTSLREAITNLQSFLGRRKTRQIVQPLVLELRKTWKGPILLYLPSKLRGLGFNHDSSGLLNALKTKSYWRCAALSIGIEREKPPSVSRWLGLPIEITPEDIVKSIASPTLLEKGGTNFALGKASKAARKTYKNVGLHDILLWYYDSTRLPEEVLVERTD